MADNTAQDGTATIGTDEIGGVHYQWMKVAYGADDAIIKPDGVTLALPVAQANYGGQKRIFSRFLDTNGNGSGTKNMNGDYSSVQEIAYIQPGASEIFRVTRMIVTIEDTSGMTAEEYGNLNISISIGVAQLRTDEDGRVTEDAMALIGRADEVLRLAEAADRLDPGPVRHPQCAGRSPAGHSAGARVPTSPRSAWCRLVTQDRNRSL